MTSRKSSEGEQERNRAIAPIILAVLIVISIVHAQSTTPIFGFSSINWIIWSALIIMIAAALLSIAFGISRVFAVPSIEAWVREEVVNLIFSVVIIILFVAFTVAIGSISSSMASDVLASSVSQSGSIKYWTYIPSTGRWDTISTSSPSCPDPCQFYMAMGFLGSTYELYGNALNATARAQAASFLIQSLGVGTTLDIEPWVSRLNLYIAFPMQPGLAIYNDILGTVTEEYMKIITALKIQEVALAYLAGLSTTFFVVGVLTRCFWFTRKFGGLLIAFGVGLYTVTPLIYVLGWYTIDRTTTVFGDPTFSTNLASLGPTMGISTLTGTSGTPSLDAFFTTNADTSSEQVGLLDSLSRAYIPTIVLPLLAIFATIGFVRQFSPMIGGDTEIAGLTRII